MPKAKLPIDMKKMPQEHLDREILRTIMMNILNSINLYDQMCYNTPDDTDLTDLIDELIKDQKDHYEAVKDLLIKLEETGDEDE